MIIQFHQVAPNIQARNPALSREHPAHDRFCNMDDLERGELVRKLIPKALREIQDQSTTL